MANIKFSAFTTETNSADVDFLVGYQGTTMKKIAPSNLAAYPFLIDSQSLYSGFVPTGLSGNPVDNTVLGIDAGASITTSNSSTIIGANAGNSVTTGNRQTIVGHDAGSSITTSSSNTIFGYEAGRGISGFSDRNVVIGDMACRSNAGDENVVIGSSAGSLFSNATADTVIIGSFAGSNSSGGSGTVAIGRQAARANSSANHVSIGYQAGYSNTTGGENTNIGYKAGYSNTTSSNRTAVGYGSLEFNTGSQNTAFGQYTLRGTSGASSGQYNTAVGYTAGEDITTGQTNSLFGWGAGKDITTGSNNTVLGYFAQPSSNTVSNEITLGNSSVTALRIPGLQSGASDGDVLTFSSGTGLITLQAGGGGGASDLNGLSDVSIDLANDSAYFINIPSGLSGATGNLVIGETAGNSLTSGYQNIAIGFEALSTLTTGRDSVAIGYRALKASNNTGAARNVALGYNAATAVTSSSAGVYIGSEVAQVATGGISDSVIIGNRAMTASTGASQSVVIGKLAGFSAGGGQGISIGYFAAGSNNNVGHHSIGYEAGYSQTSGTENTNFGYRAGYSNTTGQGRTMIGYDAGNNLTANFNTVLGSNAASSMTNSPSTSGSNNVYIGYEAAHDADARRSNNVYVGSRAGKRCHSNNQVAVGFDALGFTSTGFSQGGNIAIGFEAMRTNNATDRCIAIGYECMDGANTGDRNIALGGIIHNGDIITGDDNIMIGYDTNLSALSVSNEVNIFNGSVTARFQGAASAWSFVSDARDKKDIEDLELGLDFVTKLKPRKFKWDLRNSNVDKNKKASGFIAQEVKEVLDEVNADYTGIVDTNDPEQYTVSQANIIPMLVKAIQELKAEIELLKQ